MAIGNYINDKAIRSAHKQPRKSVIKKICHQGLECLFNLQCDLVEDLFLPLVYLGITCIFLLQAFLK